MSDVATTDFVGGADGHAASGAGFGTKVALLLNDDDDAVAWEIALDAGRWRSNGCE